MGEERQIKDIYLERSQVRLAPLDLEALIGPDHSARAIWELCGQFNLKPFEEGVKTLVGQAGRPCWPARLLVSLWVYGYSLGVASARAIERMMSHEPGLRWLSADNPVNHHTLADFRVGHQEALNELFAQFLVVLETAGLVELTTLLHDGTKVKAVAGKSSFHGRKTLQKRMATARKVVRKLDQQAANESEGMDARQRAAQERAAREKLKRAEDALKRLKKLEAAAGASEAGQQRVSESEPEARKMKHPDGGWAPSYNVQVTTEGKSRMVVGIGLTTAANDTQELLPALERAKKNCGELPQQVITDNGYATRKNVEQTASQDVELIAPWKDDASREAGACSVNGIAQEFRPSEFRAQRGGKKLACPAGRTLVLVQQKVEHGVRNDIFRAKEAECRRCRFHQACCGGRGGAREIHRPVESPAMKQYLARMKRPEVRRLYRKRCEIAEFPHLWSKGVKGLRRFSVRGMVKAGMEAVWVALTYNVTQWLRLRSQEQALAA